jgi:hypothetical protein
MSKNEKKLLRLVSALNDVSDSIEAGQILLGGVPETVHRHLLISFVVSYGRPFFESYRVGKILCDYPDYPEFGDADMPVRHSRMLDLRNKFMAHSSAEGTRVQIIPPGVSNPVNLAIEREFNFNIGKRLFPENYFVAWLIELPKAFQAQLRTDIKSLLPQLYGERKDLNKAFELTTSHEDFQWKMV